MIPLEEFTVGQDPRIGAWEESLSALHILRCHALQVLQRQTAGGEALLEAHQRLAKLVVEAGNAALDRAQCLENKVDAWLQERRAAARN